MVNYSALQSVRIYLFIYSWYSEQLCCELHSELFVICITFVTMALFVKQLVITMSVKTCCVRCLMSFIKKYTQFTILLIVFEQQFKTCYAIP